MENMFPSFFIRGRKFYTYIFFYLAGENSIRGFLFNFLVRDKKGFENTLFEIRVVVKNPPGGPGLRPVTGTFQCLRQSLRSGADTERDRERERARARERET